MISMRLPNIKFGQLLLSCDSNIITIINLQPVAISSLLALCLSFNAPFLPGLATGKTPFGQHSRWTVRLSQRQHQGIRHGENKRFDVSRVHCSVQNMFIEATRCHGAMCLWARHHVADHLQLRRSGPVVSKSSSPTLGTSLWLSVRYRREYHCFKEMLGLSRSCICVLLFIFLYTSLCLEE